MSKTVSIAEAKDHFSRLVHDAENGGAVQITRRGRPVAVLVSAAEYTRLAGTGAEFWERLHIFRQEHGLNNAGIEPEDWLDNTRATAGRSRL